MIESFDKGFLGIDYLLNVGEHQRYFDLADIAKKRGVPELPFLRSTDWLEKGEKKELVFAAIVGHLDYGLLHP